jgi:hypothetical protein
VKTQGPQPVSRLARWFPRQGSGDAGIRGPSGAWSRWDTGTGRMKRGDGVRVSSSFGRSRRLNQSVSRLSNSRIFHDHLARPLGSKT